MSYDYITQHTSPAKTEAKRGPSDIDFIVIHHWDDPARKPTFGGTVAWQVRDGAGAAGHYTVEAGKVACLVDPADIAWHAGDWDANKRSVGIECNPRASAGDYATVAELIRELRKTYGDMPLRPHRAFKSTSCPGRYDLAKLDALARGVDGGRTYRIKAGDTLGGIAAKHRTTVGRLQAHNGIKDPDRITAGTVLRIK